MKPKHIMDFTGTYQPRNKNEIVFVMPKEKWYKKLQRKFSAFFFLKMKKKNKKVQIGLREILLLLGILFLLIFVLPTFTSFINSVSTGDIDAVVNALIPLLIFAIFFEFLRRFFGVI